MREEGDAREVSLQALIMSDGDSWQRMAMADNGS